MRLAIAGTDLRDFLQPVLARDTVRYVGEPLAVVVGEDPYACEDAAELVEIDIADKPPALDATSSGNTAAELTRGYGDTDAAFAAAAHVVRIELAIGRHSGVPLEPRCLLAVPDPDRGELAIFGMTKVPVWNRDLLAGMLGVDETLIRVHAIDAGGGFGVRGEFYPEDFLIPWLAMKLGRPVKWAEDRTEHLMAANHSRQQYHRVAAAFDADGRILGLTDDITHDNGAYCRTHGVAVPELTAAMLPGPYRVPAYRGRVRVVLTNKTPCGTYRAPGRFEGTAAREHLLDVAAAQLGIDPVALRMRNLLTADRDAARAPDQHARHRPDPGHRRLPGPARGRGQGGRPPRLPRPGRAPAQRARRRGFGLAMFVEKSGLGPQETADVTVSKSGAVHVYSGGTSMGQGIETVLAQIAADALGVDPRAVRVTAGDTAAQPFGSGSWASRSTVVGGSAVHQAAAAVRERAIELAARVLEAAEEDLDLADGAVSVRGDPAVAPQPGRYRQGRRARQRLPESRRAGRAVRPPPVRGLAHDLPLRGARRGGGGGHRDRAGPGAALPGRLRGGPRDQPDAGGGPARGGVAQGIGGALFEEFRYDEAGQPQAITFIEYRLPTAAEIPPVDVLLSQDAPSPGNPLGVMGAGEGGINAVGAAVANAVRDALGLAGGVGQLPLTPARVCALAQATGGRRQRMTTEVPGYVSKTDLVAALIRELIITGELDPGEQLRQRDLAQRFHVSQTPVREAMRRLESEGLLICDTHRGFTVVAPDVGRIEENFQIRAALESLGASLAARKIDPAGLDRLRELNDRMRALADDDPGYAELNREFHFTVYEYAHSPLLLSLMRLLWASLHGGPRVSRTHAESARQHDEILAALAEGDADAASARTYQHIMGADPVKEVSG